MLMSVSLPVPVSTLGDVPVLGLTAVAGVVLRFTTTGALASEKSAVLMPAPPSKVSLPAPPISTSLPVPAAMDSLPEVAKKYSLSLPLVAPVNTPTSDCNS